MAQNNNMQVRYSSLVDAKLRAESIFAGLFNNRFQGSPVAGAVKVPFRSEATVGNYDIANGGSLNAPATSYTTIVCDKDLYVNELIDGYMAEAVPDGLIAERLESAAFALADDIDTKLEAVCVSDGTTISTAKADTIYKDIVNAAATAKAQKVNPRTMWLVVSNATYAELLQTPEFISAAGSVEELGAGYVGKIAGIPVFESANASDVEYILGNGDFCHFVEEWAVPVGVKDLADGSHIGASAVQGRKVVGFEISKPSTVLVRKPASK